MGHHSPRPVWTSLTVWHSRVHYSATRMSFATIFSASESPLKIQMLGKILKLRILTKKIVYRKAYLSGFHISKSARKLSLGFLRY
jgi:hypothetical protein